MDLNARANANRAESHIDLRTIEAPADRAAAAARDGDDVIQGLGARPKTLPPKYFYDAQGSRLFDRITALPEYYLTRTEQRILTDCARVMARRMGPADLIELGAGSARKTRLVIEALLAETPADSPLRYVPIDVSGAALEEGTAALAAAYPRLEVRGLVATYEAALADLPPRRAPRRLMMFLGSTIGNLDDAETAAFLARVSAALERGDGFLMGFDLAKTPGVIDAAYNDAAGVTAAFNLNMLRHLNRRFDGDFDLARFEAGETIRTEISRKFRVPRMQAVVESAGFKLEERWSDPADWFAVTLFRRV